ICSKDQEEHPRTFILSTHLVSEMDYLFDHVVIIDQGQLVLNEPYETLEARGASVTGAASDVEAFTADMKHLNEQQLGGTKSVMVYGELDESKRREAQTLGLEIGPVSLQDLFIYLTEEAN
ncbi:ABC transporter ATP-binding protein, partial [Planococcus sp. CP5-4_UN]|nr:ABC transporter ATP-binding protein [Planococcus sp. CP5-4_UN]